MSAYCKGCCTQHDEDDDRLCLNCENAYRPSWWAPEPPNHARGGIRLLTLIGILHEQTTGSTDAIAPELIAEYEMDLAYAIKTWKNPSTMWERALLTLAVRTLAERKATPETPPDIVCCKSNADAERVARGGGRE